MWLKSDPPKQLYEFFENEYPAMTDVESKISKVSSSVYELVGNFTLPDSNWWDYYYTPLQFKLTGLIERFKNDAEALEIVNHTRLEIEMRRLCPEYYGYEFFIGRKTQ